MTVVSATKDVEALTLTMVAEVAAAPSRAWQLWADPRLLERWWGPPTWPATFTRHLLTVGGRSEYYMTGPDGTQAHGWWTCLAVDEPRSLEIEDGFADAAGAPDRAMPVSRMHVALTEISGGTRMTIISTYADLEQMEQLVGMGMVEGMTEALGQMDRILAG